jgi:hypothetical protein
MANQFLEENGHFVFCSTSQRSKHEWSATVLVERQEGPDSDTPSVWQTLNEVFDSEEQAMERAIAYGRAVANESMGSETSAWASLACPPLQQLQPAPSGPFHFCCRSGDRSTKPLPHQKLAIRL